MTVKKAIIPAAGFGTRFLPITKALPKEMLPVVDTPAIQYVVEEALESGIESIIIVTNRHKHAIEDYFDSSTELQTLLVDREKPQLAEQLRKVSNLAEIHYIHQKEPLGLGHAILCARQFIGDEPFAVLLPDDLVRSEVPCLQQLMRVFDKNGSSVIGTELVEYDQVDKYGIVGLRDGVRPRESEMNFVQQIVEKPAIQAAPSNLAIIGRYLLEPQIFDILASLKPGNGGEIQLTDALAVLNEQSPLIAYRFQGKRYDIGNSLGYLQACVEFALHRDELRTELVAHLDTLVAKWKPLLKSTVSEVS